MTRPETVADPEIYYNAEEAARYATCSRILTIQEQMSERALELLQLGDEPGLLLDIGVGSGISAQTATEAGHYVIGMDVSKDMLYQGKTRGLNTELLLGDAGIMPYLHMGMFDGIISISALQWLCVAERDGLNPFKRLRRLFRVCRDALVPGKRAVFQFYPSSPQQAEQVCAAALRNGFTGGLVVDFPESTKSKKFYLVLTAGNHMVTASEALKLKPRRVKNPKIVKYSKEWILARKERNLLRGIKTPRHSEFTARRRSGKF